MAASCCWQHCSVSFHSLRSCLPTAPIQGPIFGNALAKILPCLEIEIVKRPDQAKGFVQLPKRWIVTVRTMLPS
jgi:putative transposase